MKAVAAFPSTAFYDSKGELAYVRQGGYPTERKLAAGHRALRSLRSPPRTSQRAGGPHPRGGRGRPARCAAGCSASEQGVDPAADQDGRDGEALHVVAFDGARARSAPAACWWPTASRGWGGWRSSPSCAGGESARAILAEAERIAPRRRRASAMRLHAQVAALGALRARRLRAGGRGLPRGGHRAPDDGAGPCLSCGSTRCRACA